MEIYDPSVAARRAIRVVAPLAFSIAAILAGCGSDGSATTSAREKVPSTTALVFLATALPCKDVRSDGPHFTPLVVHGPNYSATIDPFDGCREQPGGWRSYAYAVPMPPSGDVHLTPGDQRTATLHAAKVQANRAATIYYVNCPDYYASCPDVGRFDGRISSIEYFKDEDVRNAPD